MDSNLETKHGSVSTAFGFSSGHTLTRHTGACKYLHGHNYHGEVTVTGPIDAMGMVVDFGLLKEALNQATRNWDHQFLICEEDPRTKKLIELDPDSVVVLGVQPTAENMAELLIDRVSRCLQEIVERRGDGASPLPPQVTELILRETEGCSALSKRTPYLGKNQGHVAEFCPSQGNPQI